MTILVRSKRLNYQTILFQTIQVPKILVYLSFVVSDFISYSREVFDSNKLSSMEKKKIN